MLSLIHEQHFHTEQLQGVLDRCSHIQPFCGITTLFLRVGKQRQILHPVFHGHLPLQLCEDLAVVIQTGRSTNIFRGSTDCYHRHDRWVRFFFSEPLGHTRNHGRFPHPSCPIEGQHRVPPVPLNESHQVT